MMNELNEETNEGNERVKDRDARAREEDLTTPLDERKRIRLSGISRRSCSAKIQTNNKTKRESN